MFEWQDFHPFFGSVLTTTITCDTTVTLAVPSPGMKLRVFKVIVDGPSDPPPFRIEPL
jgi:hypothetical protein